MRVLQLLGDGFPLDPGGERGAAATQQLRVGDLPECLLRSQLDRSPQRLVALCRDAGFTQATIIPGTYFFGLIAQ